MKNEDIMNRETPTKLPRIVLGVGACVGFLWIIIYFGFYLSFGNLSVSGHQEFAKNGLSQIKPAAQMNELYRDCRHYIVYSGRESVSTWNADAYFGGRYVLTMQVPISIQSSSKGKIVGEAKFYLAEIETIDPITGGASFSRNFTFGFNDWGKVYKADGDFGVLGFSMKIEPSLKGFKKYVQKSRR